MAKYDSHVIYAFADDLYARAERITIIYAAAWGLIGTFLGYVVGEFGPSASLLTALIGLVVSGAMGYFIGSGKAFELRLQAQTILCQAAIEENTRLSSTIPATGSAPAVASYSAEPRRQTGQIEKGNQERESTSRSCPKCFAVLSDAQQTACPKCGAPIELGEYLSTLPTSEDDRVNRLLQRFQDPLAYKRESAISEVESLRLTDRRIIDALEILASSDHNESIRRIARRSLDVLSRPPDK